MAQRRFIPFVAALVLAASLAGPLGAQEGAEEDAASPFAEGTFPTEPVVVGTQGAGTFGDSPEEGELGTLIGADLREGRITMLDEDTLEFVVQLESLPSSGGTPEVVRYTWDFLVDGVKAQLDGKWSNYSRGACDPTSGQCAPPDRMPRDPGMQPFLLRANEQAGCLNPQPSADVPEVGTVGAPCGMTFNAMDELDVLQGVFDTDAATITIMVPVEKIGLVEGVDFGPCSRIAPTAGIFGGVVEAMPAAFVSSTAMPADILFPVRASLGGGVFEVPPPAGFDTCDDYLSSLDSEGGDEGSDEGGDE
jgi:hypothetical protein